METPLLATKLFIPSIRLGLVSRPRLIERLQYVFSCPLTLVSAPAGFGKTTILAQWIAGNKPTIPVAWVQLDEGDNDPVRFWDYIIASLKTLKPAAGETALTILHSAETYAIDMVLTSLLNDIAEIPSEFALVVDDFHLIKAEEIHSGITFLIDHCPPKMHLILATRVDPKMPLSHFRGRGVMAEISADDLRFTEREAADFIKLQGIELLPEDLNALNIKTEGWAAGLKMATVAMRGRKDVSQFISSFTGSQRYIMDYLLEEVLKRQPDEVSQFLLATSILEKMSASLCDYLTGLSNGHEMLLRLEQSNLFIVPLDDSRKWYRYHHLFNDLIRHQLELKFSENYVAELHRKASWWYKEHNYINDAVHHSVKAEDWSTVVRLIDESADESLFKGELSTFITWCQAVPENLLKNYAHLYVRYARVLLYTGQIDKAELALTYLEKNVGSVSDLQGEVATLQADIARRREDTPKATELAQKALMLLSETNLAYRAEASNILGTIFFSIGEFDEAWAQFTDTYEIAEQCGNVLLAVEGLAYLSNLQVQRGKLRSALEFSQRAIKLGNDLPAVGLAWHLSAMVKYEQNNLEEAIHDQELANKYFDFTGRVELKPQGHILLATYLLSAGDKNRALVEIAEVDRSISSTDIRPGIRGYLDIWRVILALRMDDPAIALKRADYLSVSSEVLNLDGRHFAARILIAKGERTAASKLLNDIFKQANRANGLGLIVAIRLYQALAADSQKDALVFLADALRNGEPEGYIRTFVDEGALLMPLLRKTLSQGVTPEYTAKLINIIEVEKRQRQFQGEAGGKPQPGLLSNREFEILQLLEKGLSNRQIAERLIISLNTSKRHVHNIFEKLNAGTRTQAIARARELKLI